MYALPHLDHDQPAFVHDTDSRSSGPHANESFPRSSLFSTMVSPCVPEQVSTLFHNSSTANPLDIRYRYLYKFQQRQTMQSWVFKMRLRMLTDHLRAPHKVRRK